MRSLYVFMSLALFCLQCIVAMAETPTPKLIISLPVTAASAGSVLVGTVQMMPPSPLKHVTVLLTPSDSSLVLSVNSVDLQGAVPQTFRVTVGNISAQTSEVITASWTGGVAAASLAVTPIALSGIVLSTASGSGVNLITGVVQLAGPAPYGGVHVTLTSSSGEVDVPYDLFIPAGSDTSAPFSLSPRTYTTPINAVITASVPIGNTVSTKTAIVTVSPRANIIAVIPAGTTVYVTPPAALSSETLKDGDFINFSVVADVKLPLISGDPTSDVEVFTKTSPVICQVMSVCHSKGVLHSGSLTIRLISVESADGTQVPVSTDQSQYDMSRLTGRDPVIEDRERSGQRFIYRNPDRFTVSRYGANGPSSIQTNKEFDVQNNSIPPPGTQTLVHGRTDSTAVAAAVLTVAATYGLTTINKSGGSVDALALGTAVTNSSFSTLFTGVPATLPPGIAFAVQTTEPTPIQVHNPLIGQ